MVCSCNTCFQKKLEWGKKYSSHQDNHIHSQHKRTKGWVHVLAWVAIWANTTETSNGDTGQGGWLLFNNTVQDLHVSATLCTWTVLYITSVIWLLRSEYKHFIHIRHSLQSWDPPGWNTHQFNLVPLLAVLPSWRGKSSANLILKKKKQKNPQKQQHMEWFFYRVTHSHSHTWALCARTQVIPSVHRLQNEKDK